MLRSKALTLLVVLAMLLVAGRRREPLPPVRLVYFPITADPAINDVLSIEFALGPDIWFPVVIDATVHEGDCISTYEWVGRRLRYCLADGRCSPMTVEGAIAVCARIHSLQ